DDKNGERKGRRFENTEKVAGKGELAAQFIKAVALQGEEFNEGHKEQDAEIGRELRRKAQRHGLQARPHKYGRILTNLVSEKKSQYGKGNIRCGQSRQRKKRPGDAVLNSFGF